MKKKNLLQRVQPYLGFATAISVLVLALVSFGYAQQGYVIQNIENAVFGSSSEFAPAESEAALGGTSHFTSDAEFSGQASFLATSTLQEVALGTRFSKALSTGRTSTTTPGGLFALQNTGEDRICDVPLIDLETAPDGAFVFNSGTSTDATSWSTNNGGSLIASTTVPTSSSRFITPLGSKAGYALGMPGTFFGGLEGGAGTTATSTKWIWKGGDYILGQYAPDDKGDKSKHASTTAMVGKVYVDCYSR